MLNEGSCHCGRIAYTVEGDFKEALDCNCSMCRRRGGLLAFVPATDFILKTPESDMGTYTFHTHKLKHHFCTVCGISPFSEGQDKEGKATRCINLRCVPAIDLDSLKITKWDGASK